MAVKKETAAAEMDTMKETAAAEMDTMKEPEQKEKLVTIQLFSDGGRYKGDLFVSVNGVNYQIKRGVRVQVPPAVAEVIQHSQEQDAQSAARLAAIVDKSE